MSLFVQDTFAEAKALGLTVGFVGTYSDLRQRVIAAVEESEAVDPDEDGSLAYERSLECNPRYWAEEEEDRLRTLYTDPIWGNC